MTITKQTFLPGKNVQPILVTTVKMKAFQNTLVQYIADIKIIRQLTHYSLIMKLTKKYLRSI